MFFSIAVCGDTQLFERLCPPVGFDGFYFRIFGREILLFENSVIRNRISHFLCKIRELVCPQQIFATGRNIHIPSGCHLPDLCLHEAFFCRSNKSAFILDIQEQLPGLFGDQRGKFLHIIGTGGRIHDLIKMSLFFQQQLLIPGNSLRKCRGIFINSIKGKNGY